MRSGGWRRTAIGHVARRVDRDVGDDVVGRGGEGPRLGACRVVRGDAEARSPRQPERSRARRRAAIRRRTMRAPALATMTAPNAGRGAITVVAAPRSTTSARSDSNAPAPPLEPAAPAPEPAAPARPPAAPARPPAAPARPPAAPARPPAAPPLPPPEAPPMFGGPATEEVPHAPPRTTSKLTNTRRRMRSKMPAQLDRYRSGAIVP